MFIVQGVSEILREPEVVRQHEEAYDRLLHETPGIRWNLYFRGLRESHRSIHLMEWSDQAASEAFGVSPAFQAMRNELVTGGGPRAQMTGPLSPGYWEPVFERRIARPPTGRDPLTLGFARHAMVFVRPGREQAWEAAIRALIDRLGTDVYTARLVRNLGQPNAYTFVVHTRSEAAARAIDLPAEHVEQATDDVYQVVLSSDWADAR
jgi:quinol monooxygenase YgiN